jgi:hypothetical protein
MMRPFFAVGTALLVITVPVTAQPTKPAWDSAADAAAEQAVTRLGAKIALDIVPKVLAIPALESGPPTQ